MPFITEEIWQALPKNRESGIGNRETETIMYAPYPTPCDRQNFPEAAADMERVMEVISGIRNIRGEMEVPPSRQIAVILSCDSPESLRLMKHNESYIISMARVSDLAIGQAIEQPQDASILVDVTAEEERLLKEIGKIEKEIEMFSRKLESPTFVDRAPAEIVAKERQKLAEVTGKKQVLEESLDKIRKLR
jgi:valyl-tRNA synthetase